MDNRAARSCQAAACAPLLIVASFLILILNEGNAVRMHRSLQEAETLTAEVHDISQVVPTHQGKLVHLFGRAVTDDQVSDPQFGVTPDISVLKLHRTVYMYQWVEESHSETRKNSDGSETTKTTYTYHRDWVSHHVDSDQFQESYRHVNPPSMPYSSASFTADPITLGAFTLSNEIVSHMDWYSSFRGTLSVNNIPDSTRASNGNILVYGNSNSQEFYIGNNPSYPTVGDLRINYENVLEQRVSIIAVQMGDTFVPYVAKAGKTILLVEQGVHTQQEMCIHAHQTATFWAWLFRFVGFAVLWWGLASIAEPLSTILDIIPSVGPCMGDAVQMAANFVTFVIALVISLIVIVISWVANRPWIVLSILGGGILILFGHLYWQRQQSLLRNGGGRFNEYESVPEAVAIVEPEIVVQGYPAPLPPPIPVPVVNGSETPNNTFEQGKYDNPKGPW
jgi:hypothetical protein